MDGRWPEFPPAAVLLDMDTLPDPSAFYQAWTRRLMNDNTDTLDAIARDIRSRANDLYAQISDDELIAWADRITALSNQGEGAAMRDGMLGTAADIPWETLHPGTRQLWQDVALAECFRVAGGDTECASTVAAQASQAVATVRDLRECYDEVENHPADADRRDAERFRFLESKARQNKAYDVFGNGGHWSIGIHSKDNRLTFAEAIDAATQEQT